MKLFLPTHNNTSTPPYPSTLNDPAPQSFVEDAMAVDDFDVKSCEKPSPSPPLYPLPSALIGTCQQPVAPTTVKSTSSVIKEKEDTPWDWDSLFEWDADAAVEVVKSSGASDYNDKFSFAESEDCDFDDNVSCGGEDIPTFYGDEGGEEEVSVGSKRTIAKRSFQFTQMQKSMRRMSLLSKTRRS
jgi:hypothetical protein